MIFLPIVGRELREAARRRGGHRARTVMALVAMLTGAVIFIINVGVITPGQMGGYIFTGLCVLAMIYCIAAGRFATADCLSIEKREGTLGLLFLTDLKGYDVVLGKLTASSVNGLYGLVALFPV